MKQSAHEIEAARWTMRSSVGAGRATGRPSARMRNAQIPTRRGTRRHSRPRPRVVGAIEPHPGASALRIDPEEPVHVARRRTHDHHRQRAPQRASPASPIRRSLRQDDGVDHVDHAVGGLD
ncbi:MAG: hypothetical protein MUF30_08535, partial [Burkholderiales bacterium]|nr:hypothetical protein [Burkholderiales bacterium]